MNSLEMKAVDSSSCTTPPIQESGSKSTEHQSIPMILDSAVLRQFMKQLPGSRTVNEPTTFGSKNEYRAVPSFIEHKPRRGKPYTSIREATEAEIKQGNPQTSIRRSTISSSSTFAPEHDGSLVDSRSPTITESVGASDSIHQHSYFTWDVSRKERLGNWFTTWFVDWWALEILSWVFSAICMLIIVGVLLRTDGKELPKWNLSVSINAFIAIFSGFAKSGLLLPTAEALGQLKWAWFMTRRKLIDFEVIDSASRGPAGSLMLLCRTKGITLASIGAAIILLSLPLDLFFQQIIALPEVQLQDELSERPTIARCVQYDPSRDQVRRSGQLVVSDDFAIESILTPYWLDQYPRMDILFQCPTSYCTFEPFFTLALDYQCMRLPRDFLQNACQATSGDWLSTSPARSPPNTTACGWFLDIPGGLPQLMSGYETRTSSTAVGEVLATRIFPLTDVLSKQQLGFNGTIMFPGITNPVVDFVVASAPSSFEGAIRGLEPVVHECEIHWTIKEISAQISTGVLHEATLSTQDFEHEFNAPWNSFDSSIYQVNFSKSLSEKDSETGHAMVSTYGLSNETASQVWQAWAEFAPSAFLRTVNENAVREEYILKMAWMWGDSPEANAIIPTGILPWDEPYNITDHVGQAVHAMNTVVRNNVLSSTRRNDTVYGTAFRHAVVVRVRWAYMSLPLILLVLVGLFLWKTILETRRNTDVGVWKTSALAILFNGAGEDVQQFVGGEKRTTSVRRKAKDMEVQLGKE